MTKLEADAIRKYQDGLLMWLDLYDRELVKLESKQDDPEMTNTYMGMMATSKDFREQLKKYKPE
jgi:molecular chaperone GrpE (heat shock protein)